MGGAELTCEKYGKASARKSYGEYRPMIVFPCGRTELLGKRGYIHREVAQTKFGYSSEYPVFKRGKHFDERKDAVSYAERTIRRRVNGMNENRKHTLVTSCGASAS